MTNHPSQQTSLFSDRVTPFLQRIAPVSRAAIFLSAVLLLSPLQGHAQNDPAPVPTEAQPDDNKPDAERAQGDETQQSQANSPDTSPASRYPTFPAPFDLQWGDGPEQILQWAAGRQFQTAWKDNAQAQGTESLLEITPPAGTDQFPDAEFNTLNFAFKSGHLVEVKVIFRYRDQTPTQANDLTQNRKALVEKGQNQAASLVGNDQNDKDGIHYSHQLWQWQRGPGLYIYLIEAEARQKKKSVISIALTYRNQSLAATLPNQPR
jgi:hypothetical protein